jgi:hypothetical protein
MVAEARATADASDPGDVGQARSIPVQCLSSSASYRIPSPLALTLRSTGLRHRRAGRILLVASNRVPLVTGQGYGWQVDASRGVIGHAWSVAPGDPAGRYVIRVFVEGRLAATFRFDV